MAQRRPLFGGAMTCEIPVSFLDLSDVRQVPDHQECWQEKNAFSLSGLGSLLVVEILERQDHVADDQAAAYFFQDLAESNGATRPEDARFRPIAGMPLEVGIQSSSNQQRLITPLFGVGHQRVELGRRFSTGGRTLDQPIQWISVELCLIRLSTLGTDLLVTLSTPIDNEPIDLMNEETFSWSDNFRRILSTLQVSNWGLFGNN